MIRLGFALVILIMGFTTFAYEARQAPASVADAKLEEIFAQNLALSPNMVLPADFMPNKVILEEIYAQNLALSPQMTLPTADGVTNALLEEIFASGYAVSYNLFITR